jgi:glycerol kinase
MRSASFCLFAVALFTNAARTMIYSIHAIMDILRQIIEWLDHQGRTDHRENVVTPEPKVISLTHHRHQSKNSINIYEVVGD